MKQTVFTAQYRSKCSETGKEIEKGSLVAYDPDTKKIFCITSPTGSKIHSDVISRNLGRGYLKKKWD